MKLFKDYSKRSIIGSIIVLITLLCMLIVLYPVIVLDSIFYLRLLGFIALINLGSILITLIMLMEDDIERQRELALKNDNIK